MSSGVFRQRKPKLACASAQSDQASHCSLTEWLDTTGCIYIEQMSRWCFAHAQDDLNAHFAHVRKHFFAWRCPLPVVQGPVVRRTLYHCKIQVKFDIGNHPPNFGWVIALIRLSFCWFVDIVFRSITFCRDALILLKICRRIYHCKIQVKFDISNHPQKFGWVMALFRLIFCRCVDIGFYSITFAGMHWF